MRDIHRIVSQNIRRHRLAKKWTQEQLAFKAKLHRAYIGQVERGHRGSARAGLRSTEQRLTTRALEFPIGAVILRCFYG